MQGAGAVQAHPTLRQILCVRQMITRGWWPGAFARGIRSRTRVAAADRHVVELRGRDLPSIREEVVEPIIVKAAHRQRTCSTHNAAQHLPRRVRLVVRPSTMPQNRQCRTSRRSPTARQVDSANQSEKRHNRPHSGSCRQQSVERTSGLRRDRRRIAARYDGPGPPLHPSWRWRSFSDVDADRARTECVRSVRPAPVRTVRKRLDLGP